ncbi:AAA family ATPase [Streptomyces sp. ME02-8801-2C]|uniref:AAA family ATPase n=1 Tax=Streptomyces sp. ME02-8801-2C TaxID=3028680 RepID=UPI0029B70AD3|nr:AAA family ATPase [Streptomyces sp. ME02-8801-2C]MDX3458060.1 AAA family ATPase [Streptomyces sp. ME02-8801-2C]
MNTLRSFTVEDLLNRFRHEVIFPNDSQFVILHGPNGVGKTRMLELVEAVFCFNLTKIFETPFSKATFEFDEKCKLTITKESKSKPINWTIPEKLIFTFLRRGSKPVTGHIESALHQFPTAVARDIAQETTQLLESGLSVKEKYRALKSGEDSPYWLESGRPRFRNTRGSLYDVSSLDEEIVTFLSGVHIHMVETQRLLILNQIKENVRRHGVDSHHQRMRVTELSNDLVRRLGAALAENSRKSQALDKSFPSRILDDNPDESIPTEKEIRALYAEQSELRNRLARIALLEESMDVALKDKELTESQRKVLGTYLRDSKEKLSTFLDLLYRVELLTSIVNKRFLFKRLVINREGGFVFVSDTGQEVPPQLLSSGEQHELVLMYDLLFNVQANSIVMIDEPEISLHVAWQQEFMGDIVRVATLAQFRFIVATHSPQIINEWWSHTIGLHSESSTEGEVS